MMGVIYRSYDEEGGLLLRETGSVSKVLGKFAIPAQSSGSIAVPIGLPGTVFFVIVPVPNPGGTFLGSRPVVVYDGNGVFSWIFAGTGGWTGGSYEVHYGVY